MAKSNQRIVKNNRSLNDIYIDDNQEVWTVVYKYDAVEVKCASLLCKVRQYDPVTFKVVSRDVASLDSVQVFANGKVLGNVVAKGQRAMICDFYNDETRLVLAQIARVGFGSVLLQIYYYKSKAYLDKKNAEYEKEKAAYVRKPPKREEVTLVSNGNEHFQWNIGAAKIGDDIWVEEDERMLVLTRECDLEIGYVPKSAERKLRDLFNIGYEVTGGKITAVFETNTGKKGVSVVLVLRDTSYL